MKFHAVDEDTIDMDMELAKIKKRLFKNELDKNDRLVDNYEKIDPTNHMIPFSTPHHLQGAPDRELDKLLKAGVLEPVEHATDWCS